MQKYKEIKKSSQTSKKAYRPIYTVYNWTVGDILDSGHIPSFRMLSPIIRRFSQWKKATDLSTVHLLGPIVSNMDMN